jgi:hypothetical protein
MSNTTRITTADLVRAFSDLDSAEKKAGKVADILTAAHENGQHAELLEAIEQYVGDDKARLATRRAQLACINEAGDDGETPRSARLSVQRRFTTTGQERKVNGSVLVQGDTLVMFRKPDAEETDAFIAIMKKAQKLADDGDERAIKLLEAYANALEIA